MSPSPRIFAILLWLGSSALGLREIQLSVPEVVGLQTTAVLHCRWALDIGESLYTVKWYHNAQEFFRFVPKELPNTRVFSQTGISVDLSRSGAQQVVLRASSRVLSGRYRCEVSADAPYFHTIYKTGFMQVVELPDGRPELRSAKTWYSPGDILRANCSAPAADPPVNITWLINGQEVKGLDIPIHEPSYTPTRRPVVSDTSLEDANRIIFSPWDAVSGYEEPVTEVIDIPGNVEALMSASEANLRNKSDVHHGSEVANKLNISTEDEKSNKSSAFSQLVMRVQSVHFHKGRLNVTCVAQVFSIWSASAVLLLDEERPQIAPVMGSRDSNSGLRRSTSYAGTLSLINCILYRHWSIR